MRLFIVVICFIAASCSGSYAQIETVNEVIDAANKASEMGVIATLWLVVGLMNVWLVWLSRSVVRCEKEKTEMFNTLIERIERQ